MQVIWNNSFIALSVLVAVIGSFTALAHAQRMRESTGNVAKVWLLAGGVTLGMAVWSMHFIGMLAFHLPIALSFDTQLTFISILPAIAAALLGFYLLQSIQLRLRQIFIGGFFMGIGIAVMHYTGMAALKMQPAISYNPWIFALSVFIAVVAATSALLIVYFNENSKLHPLVQHLLSALVMGAAIAGMHYTGMAAASFSPTSICRTVAGLNLEPLLLALMITAGLLVLFGAGWTAILYERRTMLDQLRAANKKLESSDEKLRIAASAFEVQEAVMITDANDIVLRVNQAFTKLTGYSTEEVVGKPSGVFNSAHHNQEFFQNIHSILATEKLWLGEIYDNRKDGGMYLKRTNISAVSNDKDQISNYVMAFSDISQFKEAQDNIQRLAFYDPLTNLPNRRLLQEKQEKAIAASVISKHFGAILFIDLDNFKTLNDTKGHVIGDMMLVEVAFRLQETLRLHDTVARLGGR
jgi:PAS domain S-box-containing protein